METEFEELLNYYMVWDSGDVFIILFHEDTGWSIVHFVYNGVFMNMDEFKHYATSF